MTNVADLLRDAASLAAEMPAHRYVVNLCGDRYRFTVALAAALLREQITLLPQDATEGVLGQLAVDYRDLYCLHDGPAPQAAGACFAFSGPLARSSAPARMPQIPESQPAVVLFTSGSTGRPAPHLKRWGTLVRSSLAAGARLGIAALPGATVIGTVPHQHSYGLESTILLALQHGLALYGGRPFYPADILSAILAAPRPRILITAPIHLRAILADAGELPPLDLIVSATAPLAPALAAEAEARFAAPLLEIYGCSEAGQLALRRTAASAEWRSLDSVALRQDMAGTWASGAVVEGEVLLGDVLELLGADRFLLHGRMADLVNIAGKRTSLAYLNAQLTSIPGVVDGVFVAPEETGAGIARLAAYAVAPGLSEKAILAELRRRIDTAFLPRPLRCVEALPRNHLGKLPHEAVRRLAAEQDG